MSKRFLIHLLLSLMLTGASVSTLLGQVSKEFDRVISEILDKRLRKSTGLHGSHFLEAANEANKLLTPSLNSLITNNISSFPLSTSTPIIGFDFSTGAPVSTTESLGPVFSETAQTIGKGKVFVGFNYSYLQLSRFRGLSTEDMRFTFAHQDITGDTTLGDNPTENDLIDLVLGMKVTANIFVLHGSVGVTNDFDVGIAIPLINVNLSGTAVATISSFTFANLGAAFHTFGGDSLRPILETRVPYDASSTGIGDIALRAKYTIAKGQGLDAAALADIRVPTGKKDDYLGSGKASFRVMGVLSRRFSDFIPHLNLGYEHRSADFQSPRLDFRAGFDQKLLSGLTFAMDLLGTIDLDKDKAIKLFPGAKTTTQRTSGGFGNGEYARRVGLSNIPDRSNDNTYSVSVGFKYAPSERVIVLANILSPLNDGGLRASAAPTVGFSFTF